MVKKALMKAEHYAEIFASKMIMTLSEDGETPIVSYPYPVYEGEELNTLLASSEWSSSDSIL